MLGQPRAGRKFFFNPVKTPFHGIRQNHVMPKFINRNFLHQRRGPIAGLYAVGNAAAHTEYGVGYQAGHSLTSGMTFGYLAVLHMRDRNANAT